jgi:eukaryotic-like serine/threonine-protein kinase
MSAGDAQLDVGTIVGGKYRLSRALGEGAMGSVWAAVHEVLGREVAIKFLHQSFEDATTARERFAAEARAAALVKHRFVVDVFDYGVSEGGVPYMVQELLQGRPLSDLLTEGPAWSIRDAVRLMMDCLSGLAAVHQRGIIHRDLKPENIFVIPEVEGSVPKLLDFGISKTASASHGSTPKRPSLRAPGRGRLTAIGAVLGTPAYMSPEQLRNLSTLDARADLYSLGVVFYEWLAGHCPYASNTNFAELVETIEAYAMEPLAFLRPDIGDELCAVVSRALEPDRDKRYGTALEMRAALAKVLPRVPEASTFVQQAAQPALRLPVLRVPQLNVPLPTFSVVPASLPAPARPQLQPSLAPGMSLQPAGMRRAPSWKFWSGLAVVVGLTLGFTFALRSLSSQTVPRVQAAPVVRPVASSAMQLPSAEPAPAQAPEELLPFGTLPPDNLPDQELSAPALPSAEPHERKRASKATSATQAPTPALRAPPAASEPARPPAQASTPVSDAQPKRAPGSDKLLRSLDF